MRLRSVLLLAVVLGLALLEVGCIGRWRPPGDVSGYVFIRADTLPVTTAGYEEANWVPMGGAEDVMILTHSTAPAGFEPLAGAKVTVSSTKVTTDGNGFFYAADIPSGLRFLRIDHPALRQEFSAIIAVVEHEVTQFTYQAPVGWFMFVGIEQYQFLDSVQGARLDAEGMEAALSESGTLAGYRFSLYDEAATKAAILAGISQAIADARSHDYFVLYFSGRTAGSGHYGDDFWIDNIAPHGARDFGSGWEQTVITDGELYNVLRAFPGHVTLILDASHSGSFADGEVFHQQQVSPMAFRRPGYSVLASSRPEQLAYGSDETGGMSVFTYFALRGLLQETQLGRRAADSSNNGAITASELHNYVRNAMASFFGAENAAPQQPFLWNGNTVVYRYR